MMEPRTGLSVWAGVNWESPWQLRTCWTPLSVASQCVWIFHQGHSLDAQDGIERALNVAFPALAGARTNSPE
jgi:hypothetical protein